MAGSIIRDPHELKKFANELEKYVGDMKAISAFLGNDIADAQGQMRDDVSRRAFTEIGNFRDAIALEMAYCVDLIEKLRKSAKHLEAAADTFGIR